MIKYFLKIIKSNYFLLFYLICAFACQIIFGTYLLHTVFKGIIYALLEFSFVLLAYCIVYKNTKHQTPVFSIKYPAVELLVCGISIGIFMIFLFSAHLATTDFLQRMNMLFHQIDISQNMKINAVVRTNLFFVFIPGLAALIIEKNIKQFSIQKFNIRLIFFLLILYFPIIIIQTKNMKDLLIYLPLYLTLAAIPEEFCFRGLLQKRFMLLFKNPVTAIIITSIIFGFVHIPINVHHYGILIGIAACIGQNSFGGMFAGFLFYRTDSIWIAILFHLISGIALS